MFNDCEPNTNGHTVRLSEDGDGFFSVLFERLEYVAVIPVGQNVKALEGDIDYYD
jgi:hypothetical protein